MNREIGSWHTFVDVNGMSGNWKKDKNRPGHSFSGYGLNVGVFKELNQNLMAGIMLGNYKTHAKIKSNKGKFDVDSITVGPFLSWAKDSWHIDTALMLSKNSYSTSRTDLANKKLKADFSGTGLAAYFGIGYDINMDHKVPGLTVTPMMELLYSNSSHNSYAEKSSNGNNPLAIKAGKKSTSQHLVRLGSEVSYLLPNLENPTEISAALGIQQQSIGKYDNSYTYHQTTAGNSNSNPFTAPSVSDSGIFYEVGIQRLVSDTATLRLDYMGTSGSKSHSNGVKLTFEKKF